MKTLSTFTQGVKGGNTKCQYHGYVAVGVGYEKIMSIDNYSGAGDSYKQREQPVICIFNGFDCIFEGTHEQLIAKIKQ